MLRGDPDRAAGHAGARTALLEGHADFVTTEAIVNLLLSGSAAYLSWTQNLRALFGSRG